MSEPPTKPETALETVQVLLSREEAEARAERFENMADGAEGVASERELSNGLAEDIAALREQAAQLRAALDRPAEPPQNTFERAEAERLTQSALEQALLLLRDGLPDESERDSSMRIKAKWAVENALKARKELGGDDHA